MEYGLESSPVVCEIVEDRLNQYADGELALDAQAELFAHLAVCDACRRYLEGLIAFRRMVGDEPLAVPPAVDEAFLQRLAAHRGKVASMKTRVERRERMRSVIPVAGRAAVVTLVLGMVVGNIISNEIADSPLPGRVVAEEELVNFPASRDARADYSAVYVFYPGLTVEADNWVEPIAVEPL